MKPKISVIIPAYNEEKYIERPLNSLNSQTFKDFEIIVVADSCTDNTAEVAQNFGAKVIEVNTRDNGKNRNIGARAAKADILLFVDADVRFSNCYHEETYKHGSNGSSTGRPLYAVDSSHLIIKHQYDPVNWFKIPVFPNTFYIKREVFEQIGGFPEGFGNVLEDTEISEKAYKISKPKILKSVAYNSDRRYREVGLMRELMAFVGVGFVYYILRKQLKLDIRPKWHICR
ncbi:glycosyltransferase [Candidatus Woesearchaeota archaeon]|nr:glycosyltransferase [Candidatus Woesearchaeota archaeon]